MIFVILFHLNNFCLFYFNRVSFCGRYFCQFWINSRKSIARNFKILFYNFIQLFITKSRNLCTTWQKSGDFSANQEFERLGQKSEVTHRERWNVFHLLTNPAGNYMFKVNNRNTRARCEICSNLTIKKPE